MTEPERRAHEEESVADVDIDAVLYEEQPAAAPADGGFTLAFAQPDPEPEPPPPAPRAEREYAPPQGHATGTVPPRRTGARPGANTRAKQGRNKRKAPKKKPESLPVKILYAPVRAVNKISAWVMGSGINQRNPLIVTLRLLTVVMPIFISMYLTYMSMGIMFPGSGSVFADANETKLLMDDSSNPVFQIGSKRLTIPLPEGFEIITLDEYYERYPLAKTVAGRDDFTITFAAGRSEEPVYFLNVGVTGDHATQNYTERSFAKMLRDTMRLKDARSMVQQGQNQAVSAFDITERSACFGRLAAASDMTGQTTERLRQYSCIVYVNGKAVTINLGFAYKTESGESGDDSWCREALLAWRDAILAGGN